MRQNRRHQVIVNKSFQSRVIISSMWVPCLCLMASSVLLAVFCRRLNDEAMLTDADLPSIVPVFLVSVGFVFLATVFTLVHGVRMSHRIAGPVVNFEQTLKRFKAGEHTARILLRRRDLLIDAADRVNDFLDWAEENLPEMSETAQAADPVATREPEAAGSSADA